MPAGEYGEVVFTTLTREAMPLIRYRTGDAAGSSRSRARAARHCGGWSGCAHGTAAARFCAAAASWTRLRWTSRCFALSPVLDACTGLRHEGDLDVLDVEVLAPGAGARPARGRHCGA